ATGVENATTETFTVVPAEAASLELAGLTLTAVAGATREVQVTVWDAFGNVATNYTGTLVVRSTDATASLPASHVFTATDAGHFTFAGIVLKRAGSHQVTVQDVGVATLSGLQNVGVVAGEPSTLAFTQVPT
ncbi:hypothetical protein, partial [Corallococcus sp. AB038B]